MSESRAFSAPGKALLVGGYLVLDPRYKSYVIALSARMHAVVHASKIPDNDKLHLKITSSQFNHNSWGYIVSREDGFLPLENNGQSNPFIEQVIFNVCNYFFHNEIINNNIEIQIFSDPEYHSQENTKVLTNGIKSFHFHEHNITDVPKTGLGSSAGLVTVLTTALCSFFKEDLNVINIEHQRIIHNLAQVAHCQAQGKIGSGFDVAAATFGSIIYRRFAPEIIADLPQMNLSSIEKYHKALRTLVDRVDWNISAEHVNLPNGFKLIMGDVNSGSETVKLVQKVNKWYVENQPHSYEIYEDINKNNMKVIELCIELNKLSEETPDYYEKLLKSFKNGTVDNYPELVGIKDSVKTIRKNFRFITGQSGADIEPAVQTELLDNCLQLNGVLTGLIPGAGGFDAISLIASEETDIIAETKGQESFKNVTWMKLKQAEHGIMEENPVHYQNLST